MGANESKNFIYPFLQAYLPALKDAVVIEAGAHMGEDTRRIARLLAPPFSYYLYEPDGRCWDALTDLLLEAPYGPYLDFFGLALGDSLAQRDFWFSSGKKNGAEAASCCGSLKEPTGHLQNWPWIKFHKGTVTTVTLDGLLKMHNLHQVDFIWADVQGAELELIRGGLEIFRRARYFYTECYPDEVELYRGQPHRAEILAALPGEWAAVASSRTDLLLQNFTLYKERVRAGWEK